MAARRGGERERERGGEPGERRDREGPRRRESLSIDQGRHRRLFDLPGERQGEGPALACGADDQPGGGRFHGRSDADHAVCRTRMACCSPAWASCSRRSRAAMPKTASRNRRSRAWQQRAQQAAQGLGFAGVAPGTRHRAGERRRARLSDGGARRRWGARRGGAGRAGGRDDRRHRLGERRGAARAAAVARASLSGPSIRSGRTHWSNCSPVTWPERERGGAQRRAFAMRLLGDLRRPCRSRCAG